MTDRYGKAIEADFIRFYGLDIGDFLWGRRRPRQAIRLIDLLPPESATRAQMATDATITRKGGGKKAPLWRQVYDRQAKDVLMDLWELTVDVNSDGKSRRRKAKHPDPTRKRG